MDLQAMDRAHRIGQKKEVQVRRARVWGRVWGVWVWVGCGLCAGGKGGWSGPLIGQP